MKSINDDDLDSPGREFSLPSEIVKVSRPARVNMRQQLPREISVASAPDAPDVDIARYLHAVRRNWLLGAVLGIVCSLPLALLMYKLNSNQYTAVEFLRVSAHHVPLVFETIDGGTRFDVKSFKNTQRQLLMQPLALNKALKDSDTSLSPIVRSQSDPISWLQKQIKVTFPDEAEIMNVSLTLPDPTVAHRIVKAVVDTYMQDVVSKEKAERQDRVERLERILVEAEDKVRKKRNELSNIVETLGTGDSPTLNVQHQAALQQLGLLRAELSKINFEMMRAKGELKATSVAQKSGEVDPANPNSKLEMKVADSQGVSGVKSAQNPLTQQSPADAKVDSESPQEITDPRLLELLETDPVAAPLKAKIEQLQKQIAQAEKRYDPKTAASYIAGYRTRMAENKQKLEARTKRIQELNDLSGAPTLGRAENLPLKISILETHDAQIRKEMKELELESKKIGRSSIDVEMKRKEINGLDPVVEKVSQEIERTRIELQSASRITQYPTTGIPTIGENKKRLPLTAAAGLFGLFFPMALLVFLDSRKNHVNNVRTINDGLKLTVLGSIPRVPTRLMRRLNDPASSGAKVWRDRVSESMSAVTAMLLRKLASEGHRVIMISSAMPGEGKSTLSEQLARSLADSGHRTLLIDFDLRRPTMHLRFDTQLEPGVSEVLRHGADLLQTVRQTDSANLSLLTAGNCFGSLLLESANGSLESLFNQCRTEYELVLVDSSPLLPVVDGRLVGQHTDGAILTIVKDTSQVPMVMAARKTLGDYGIAVLGCVFTGDESSGDYSGNGTYGSYNGTTTKGTPSLENKLSRQTNAL